jgi:anaerobic glycerol-3-phosphate dehydrogenase
MKNLIALGPRAGWYPLILGCAAGVPIGTAVRAGEVAGFALESRGDGIRLQAQDGQSDEC